MTNKVSDDVLEVMELFDEAIGTAPFDADGNEELSGNAAIETAIVLLKGGSKSIPINRKGRIPCPSGG